MFVKPFAFDQENEVTYTHETEAAQSSTEEQLENRPPFLKRIMQCVEEKSPENRPACAMQALRYQPEQNQGMLPYGMQAMQYPAARYPAARYPEENYAVQKAEAMEQVKTKGAIVRATEKEKIRLASAEIRSLRKEEEGERKKAQFEELEITETGQIHVVTRNLRVEEIPREVTDMTYPSLTVLIRAKNIDQRIFRFTCHVGRNQKELYFDHEKVGSGTYLLKKFVSIGVYFKLQTASLQKKFALQLMSCLINNCNEEKILPEMPGWMRWPDGRYTFVKEEDLTWEYVQQKIK